MTVIHRIMSWCKPILPADHWVHDKDNGSIDISVEEYQKLSKELQHQINKNHFAKHLIFTKDHKDE